MELQEAIQLIQSAFDFLFKRHGFKIEKVERDPRDIGIIVITTSEKCKIVFHYEAAWGILFGHPKWNYEGMLSKWVPYPVILERIYGDFPEELRKPGFSHSEYLFRVAQFIEKVFDEIENFCARLVL